MECDENERVVKDNTATIKETPSWAEVKVVAEGKSAKYREENGLARVDKSM